MICYNFNAYQNKPQSFFDIFPEMNLSLSLRSYNDINVIIHQQKNNSH